MTGQTKPLRRDARDNVAEVRAAAVEDLFCLLWMAGGPIARPAPRSSPPRTGRGATSDPPLPPFPVNS